MKKSKAVKIGIIICLLVTIISACSTQRIPSPEAVPSKTATTPPTIAPTDTPLPTPSSTPSPTPTPVYYVRADTQPQSTDPNTLIFASIEFEGFDPASSFGRIIQNVYETLVFFDAEKPDVFVPHLAESWEVSPDGKTYTFHIRKGVKFHNGDTLTPSDVAYSFQRDLLQGGSKSPQYLISEPVLGTGVLDIAQLVDTSGNLVDNSDYLKLAKPETLKSVCEKIKSAIVADDSAGTVTVQLAQPWSSFISIIAHPSTSIMDAKWVAENGGWDGSCDTWQNFYAGWDNPFKDHANGTGPFKLAQWGKWRTWGTGSVNQAEIILIRNDNYWRELAKLQRIDIKYDWKHNGDTTLSMMKLNTVDAVLAYDDYHKKLEEFVGERCEYDPIANVYKPCEIVDEKKSFIEFSGRPVNSQPILLFNFNIPGSYGNPSLGTARLDGKGIPNDFFSDVHIRKAFAYCFDWDTFIKDSYGGKAVRSTQLLLPNMLGFNPDIPQYQFDLAACEKEFKLADVDKDGIPAGEDQDDVWKTGFQLMVPKSYDDRITFVTKILAKNVSSINPKFVIKLGAIYLKDDSSPILIGDWREDIHDPYNWFQPFIAGHYGKLESVPDNLKSQFQEIFNRALAENDPLKRAEIYKEASLLYYNEAVGLPLVLTPDDYFWQRWVQGMSLNPLFPRSYFYPIYKK